MIVLGIETSCDDTCAAVVKKERNRITSLSGVVSSQAELHKEWGGVYPSLAKREHQKNCVPVTEKALKEAGLLEKGKGETCEKIEEIMSREKDLLIKTKEFLSCYKKPAIDAVAVTVGPGLDPCLWVGVNFAKTLACAYDIPVIPVNHIQAHILSFLLSNEKVEYPAVALIASGGHTELVLMKDIQTFVSLGKTRDDAAGECFDKTARILGLPYPGGPEISKLAKKAKKSSVKLPRPMIHSKNYDFSFSGLKTAVLYTKKEYNKSEMAWEIEEAITDVLVSKLIKAGEEYGAKTLIIGGGVTANEKLREKIKEKAVIPPLHLSIDNAEMIAATALAIGKKEKQENISADANLKIDFPLNLN